MRIVWSNSETMPNLTGGEMLQPMLKNRSLNSPLIRIWVISIGPTLCKLICLCQCRSPKIVHAWEAIKQVSTRVWHSVGSSIRCHRVMPLCFKRIMHRQFQTLTLFWKEHRSSSMCRQLGLLNAARTRILRVSTKVEWSMQHLQLMRALRQSLNWAASIRSLDQMKATYSQVWLENHRMRWKLTIQSTSKVMTSCTRQARVLINVSYLGKNQPRSSIRSRCIPIVLRVYLMMLKLPTALKEV